MTGAFHSALQAANAIMHEPAPHDEDQVQLVAGALLLAVDQLGRVEEQESGEPAPGS